MSRSGRQPLLSVVTSDARSCIAGGILGSSDKCGAAGWGENSALQISWVHLLSRSQEGGEKINGTKQKQLPTVEAQRWIKSLAEVSTQMFEIP